MFGAVADHDARQLVDDADELSQLLLATDDGFPVGTLRMTCGLDTNFPPDLVDTYSLDRFEGPVPREAIIVMTRFMVRPQLRGSTVPFRMIEEATRFLVEETPVEATFCDCQPHLIGLYLRLGFRAYRHTHTHTTTRTWR